MAEGDARVLADWFATHRTPEPVTVTYPDGDDISMDVEKLQVLVGVGSDGKLTLHDPAPLFDRYRLFPRRISGTAKVHDLDSFVDHVNRFKDAQSALWCHIDDTNPTLLAVLDYHQGALEKPFTTDDAKAETEEFDEFGHLHARFCQHRTLYAFPLSNEWKLWKASDKVRMTQADFAAFLEDRILDVCERNPEDLSPRVAQMSSILGGRFASIGRLVDLSRGMQVHAEENVRQAVNLNTGEMQISFEQKHADADGTPIKVPNLFLIAIPIWKSGALFMIPVRLRYRIQAGRLTWQYEMAFVAEQFEEAIREAANAARERTALPLFYGAPE